MFDEVAQNGSKFLMARQVDLVLEAVMEVGISTGKGHNKLEFLLRTKSEFASLFLINFLILFHS